MLQRNPEVVRERSAEGPASMKRETLAVHGGFDNDPATKAVAVPIYQTASYAFDSADHGAALFNLEVDGFRYTRIGNPTNAVLEKRVAAMEGGIDALSVACGQAAVNYAVTNIAEMGTNIVSVPQLYGTTHTLFAHILPRQGITVRFSEDDRPASMERLIDDETRAGSARASEIRPETSATSKRWPRSPQARRAADRRQHGGYPDPAKTDRIRR